MNLSRRALLSLISLVLLVGMTVLAWCSVSSKTLKPSNDAFSIQPPVITAPGTNSTASTNSTADRLAILVIASRGEPGSVYEYYLKRLWPETVRRCGGLRADVFLVFGRDADLSDGLPGIPRENIIVAPFPETYSPGILQKTAHALELLAARGYRAVFRTNISSAVSPERLLAHVDERGGVSYSSGIVFDGLREHLIGYGEDPGFLATLGAFESDAYCSGSGFFINEREIAAVLRRLPELTAADPEHRLIDDVAIGLCLPKRPPPERLPGFAEVFSEAGRGRWEDMLRNRATAVPHARLEHLSVDSAARALDLLLGPPAP
jgi:hypothetical protein